MAKESLDKLLHYGVKRRSGRYPWGSGEDPFQSSKSAKFLEEYESLKAKGLHPNDIAKELGMNSTQLRSSITWARKEQREWIHSQAHMLRDEGLSKTEIARRLNTSEATIRNYLSNRTQKEVQLDNVTDAIKKGVENTGYLDVGTGVELQLGVSSTKMKAVINKMVEDEGYHIHEVYVKRLNDPSKWTTVKVLTKEPDLEVVKQNKDQIRALDSWSDDGGFTIHNVRPPKLIDLNRVQIRYAEDGGAEKDGLIEMRRGVEDLDLGNSRYAQVRIATEGNLYLKGMAAYSDTKFPDGVDIIFNTNKGKDVPKEKVLKKMKDDMDNPFGANIKPAGQRGALNIVNEEGDWDTWSKNMSSQFLSKQPTSLIKDRLEATIKTLKKEHDEIMALTNPVVKKQLLDDFSEGLEAKARHLKAQGLKDTMNHVILPFPDMNANEVYAPNYNDGDRVVLVRHPHGGRFEIPDLVVNNKHATAKKIIGTDAPDAIGIHPSVASKLSGADFDGDTVLVIPNNSGRIKTSRTLKELKGFEPTAEYKVGPDSPANIHRRDKKTGKLYNTGKTIEEATKQIEMGKISNLITDMTIKDASQAEIARAVRHSMVVIDSEKHNLDYKRSARDNGIAALRKKYQTRVNPETGRVGIGASTLISRSKHKVDISGVKPGTKRKGLVESDFDPDKYSSKTAVEDLYSNYIRSLQSLRNTGIKKSRTIQKPSRSKVAAEVYAPEVRSIEEKLKTALLNRPKERQAQILAEKLYWENIKPNMSKDDLGKLKSRSTARARVTVGSDSKGSRIKLTEKEWEAIQARAISSTKLEQVLQNADMDLVRKLATPRQLKLSSAKASRAQQLLSKGYTYAEVSQVMGVSTTAIREALANEG